MANNLHKLVFLLKVVLGATEGHDFSTLMDQASEVITPLAPGVRVSAKKNVLGGGVLKAETFESFPPKLQP